MSRSHTLRFTSPFALSAKPGRHVSQRDPFKLERRRASREPAKGMLAASYTNGIDRFGITHLHITDRSTGGLGATSAVELPPGLTVTICPEGSTIPWLTAKCVRCEPCDDGYRVGLKYDSLAAA